MKSTVNKVGITFGIILAIYYILFNCVIFFTDQTLFANTLAGFFNMGVVVCLGILSVLVAKNKCGGYVTFREAFTPYLIMITIGVTVNYIVYNLLFNVVDPAAKDVVNKALYEMLIQTLDKSGLPQDQIDEQLQKARDISQFAPKSQLFMWAGSILRNSILGLLLAAIFKNKSEFEFISPVEQQKEVTAEPKQPKKRK